MTSPSTTAGPGSGTSSAARAATGRSTRTARRSAPSPPRARRRTRSGNRHGATAPLTFHWLDALPVRPDRAEILEGLVAAGEVFGIVAPPGDGKSTLAAYLAACIAGGVPFLGRETTLDAWRAATMDAFGARKQDAKRTAWRKAHRVLIERGIAEIEGETVSVSGRERGVSGSDAFTGRKRERKRER